MTHNIIIDPKNWDDIRGLKPLIDALYSKEAPARIVGGAVRDKISGIDFHDIDIATPLLPDIVIQKLDDAGIKTIPTGLQHGTITAVSQGNSYEVTTLRKDIESDGRHAIVEFSDNWRDDAMRRDFTINALYADPVTGEVFDYFNGIADLEQQCVRFIGNAQERIEEDHLRILRYFRFLSRFENAQIDEDSLAACKILSNRQMALARERISNELIKILSRKNPSMAVSLAYKNGILTPFLPEISKQSIEKLDKIIQKENLYNISPTPMRRLAALLQNSIESSDKIASRLKFSNQMRKSLLTRLTTGKINLGNWKKLTFIHGKTAALDLQLLYNDTKEINECLNNIQNWDIPSFTLKGGTLIQRGLPAGPIVSQCLQQIKKEWMNNDFPDGNALENIIRKIIDQNLLLISSEDKNL